MRFAHISDLHFGAFSLNPLQFFSKRWLGNWNFLLSRKQAFDYQRLDELIELFRAEKITHVLISGDFTVTARAREFKKAKKYIEKLKDAGFTVYQIPGNHDAYTKRAAKSKRFYQFFPSRFDDSCPVELSTDRITYTKLDSGLWLLALDTTFATSFLSAQGHFSSEMQQSLQQALDNIPEEDAIIVMNHYPLFHNEEGRRELIGVDFLKNVLRKRESIFLYLNGHTHRQTIADLRPSRLPLLSDSGCTVHKKHGACHVFELDPKKIHLQVFRHNDGWEKAETHEFAR